MTPTPKVRRTSARGLPPVNWAVQAERYAADPSMTFQTIADDTGRTHSTVKTHAEKERWGELRRLTQARTREAVRARLQERTELFATKRQSLMLTIAERGLRALAANLAAPAGEDGFGSNKVDAYQLQAMLKTLDDGTLAGKVAEQLTPVLLQALDRETTMALVRERIGAFQPPHKNGVATTHSTQKPACANGRVASLFSRPNGSS